MQIHLMNLDRGSDRLREFDERNAHLRTNVSRVSAVDGKSVSRDELVALRIMEPDLAYNNGALGNALTHLALWNLAIAKNEVVTVCEDDAIFNRDFISAAEAVLKSLPQNWDVVFWGWNFDSILWFDMIPGVSSCVGVFDQAKLRNGMPEFQAALLVPQPFRLLQLFGTVCYSVSPAGAQAIKNFCLPLRNMTIYFPGLGRSVANRDLGVMINGVFPNINAFVSVPPLAITKNDHSISTVQNVP